MKQYFGIIQDEQGVVTLSWKMIVNYTVESMCGRKREIDFEKNLRSVY